MSYSTPPSYSATGFTVTNVAANTTLVASPGVGFAIRVVYVQFSLRQTVAAGIVDFVLQDGAGGTGILICNLDVAAARTVQFNLPEPGIQISENTLLNIQKIASVAGPLSVAASALFFIDQLN